MGAPVLQSAPHRKRSDHSWRRLMQLRPCLDVADAESLHRHAAIVGTLANKLYDDGEVYAGMCGARPRVILRDKLTRSRRSLYARTRLQIRAACRRTWLPRRTSADMHRPSSWAPPVSWYCGKAAAKAAADREF